MSWLLLIVGVLMVGALKMAHNRSEAVSLCMELAPSERVGALYCELNPWQMIELWNR